MSRPIRDFFASQTCGLLAIISILFVVNAIFSGRHVNPNTGVEVSNFLNAGTLFAIGKDASFFGIMAVGVTMVILTAGIDLSVGAIYALAGVTTALLLEQTAWGPTPTVAAALGICLLVGLVAGFINGALTVGLKVHPFIVTLGMLMVFRWAALLVSGARSIGGPEALAIVKADFGLGHMAQPIPLFVMLVVAIAGAVLLSRTILGRRIIAVGGNREAARFAGIRISRVLIWVYVLSGLTAGIAAFLNLGIYGSASSNDGQMYELYVIASAVVGGASLNGGRGSAINAMLGAVLIALMKQSIITLGIDTIHEKGVIGCAIILAVFLDSLKSRIAKR